MIASLVILVLILLGFLWWWIVQPHGHDALGRDAQLPLFSVRTPGRSAVRVIGVGARRARTARGPAGARPAEGRPAPARPASEEPIAAQPVAAPPVVAPMPASAPPTAPANGASAHVATAAGNGAGPVPPTQPAGRRPATEQRRPLADREVTIDGAVAAADGRGVLPDDLKWAPPAQPAPANGTVEFLPGRLDVVQGRGVAGQEVRFVRPARPGERPVVTFGRGEGPLYRHVQLNVPTVSRLHARLSLDAAAGGWVVENLSSTNPTVVNGEELPAGDTPRPLRDGDRLEMGEVVFTYHVR